jgi:hypothetical protein
LVPHENISVSKPLLLLNSETWSRGVDMRLKCVALFFVNLLSQNLLSLRMFLPVDIELIEPLALTRLEILVALSVLERARGLY